jgi:hypothetical protein
MLHRQPQPGSWSLGQVYTHIIDDSNWYVEQMKAALATEANSDQEMDDRAKYMIRNNGFPDMLIEGPSTNKPVAQPQSKAAIVQSLETIKEEVNRLDFSHAVGKTLHPGFLYLNAQEWLQLLEMHMRHHFRQKKRIDSVLHH